MWPLISSSRISLASPSASSGVSAKRTPPAFMRPPVSTCDLMTTGPATSAAIRLASSAVWAYPPGATGMRSRSKILRDSYSKNLMAAREPSRSALIEPGELPQKRVQSGALVLVQRAHEHVGRLARFALEDPDLTRPFLGEVDRAATPVGRVHATLGDAARLEVVEQRDHRARVHAGQRREVLLRDPRALRDDRDQSELTRMEAVGLEQRKEVAPRFLAQVAQQEAGVSRELFRWQVRVEHGHPTLTCSANRL